MSESSNIAKGVLVIFGGLPGTGKTSIARVLARELGAVYLRIDSIEQSIDGSRALDDLGYRVANAVAEDNLRLGRIVIADCVNPVRISRDAWIEVAQRANAAAVEIEITCSDLEQHRRRVETRVADIAGTKVPTWEEVVTREYEPWDRQRIVIDTADRSIAENVEQLRQALRSAVGL